MCMKCYKFSARGALFKVRPFVLSLIISLHVIAIAALRLNGG